MSVIDAIFGQTAAGGHSAPAPAGDEQALAELREELQEPDFYRPYIIRARPVVGFSFVEKDGRSRGFQYHTLRLPDFRPGPPGKEILTFVADGMAIGMEGSGLKLLWRALVRHTLYEARQYDAKPETERSYPLGVVRIERIDIIEPPEGSEDAQRQQAGPRLVKLQ